MRFLPPLNALRAFEAAARHQSLTKAAEELNVTRAAVSQQVKQLEGYLNAVLFERTGAKLSLTEDAKYYLPLLTHTFSCLSAGTEQLFERGRRDAVSLNIAQSFCAQWLIPKLADFRCHHPDIDLKVSTTSNAFPNGSMTTDIEIVNGIGHPLPPNALRLVDESWLVVVKPDYLTGKHVTLEDIVAAEKIATTGYSQGWEQWFEAQGYVGRFNKPCLQFDHSLLAIDAAIHGLGLLLVKDILVQKHLTQGSLAQLWQQKVPTEGGHFLINHQPHKASAVCFVKWLQLQLTPQE